MKHRHYSWLAQAVYLTPVTWVALTGCQGLAASTFVVLTPPPLVEPRNIGGDTELEPTLGPGNTAPTPARLAQPTMSSASTEKLPSAAPGLYEVRSAAQARALLLKATASLEAKDFDGAAIQLERYLKAYPDSALIRLQVAELHFRQAHFVDARRQFNQALAEVIDPELPLHCRLHAHSRLMEIASEQRDRFSEELHRGIGLSLLAEHRRNEQSQEGVHVQELLGKARLALEKAERLSPRDARPALYLISVWQRMQQHRNAGLALEQARHLSFGTRLNPFEQVQLAQWTLTLADKRP